MGSLFKQFGTAINSYGRGFAFLYKPGYRRYLALPIIINIGFLLTLIWVSIQFSRPLLNQILQWFGTNLAEFSVTWSSVMVAVLLIIQFLLFLSVYKYLVLIVLAPLLAFLSEKIEREQKGEDYPFSLAQFFKDLGRALLINTWNFLREVFFTIVLTLLGFVPFLAVLIPFVILLMQSYFYGYGLMDYNAERWRFGFKDTETWMWRHKGAVIGTGLVFHLVFLIPFLGWILAPVWGVVAATLSGLSLREGEHTIGVGSLKN